MGRSEYCLWNRYRDKALLVRKALLFPLMEGTVSGETAPTGGSTFFMLCFSIGCWVVGEPGVLVQIYLDKGRFLFRSLGRMVLGVWWGVWVTKVIRGLFLAPLSLSSEQEIRNFIPSEIL